MAALAKNKKCTKCNMTKSLNEFYKRSDRKTLEDRGANGRASHCKQCKKNHYKKRFSSDVAFREKMRSNSKKWSEKNPFKARFNRNRANALNGNRRKIIEFDLDFNYVLNLWEKGCYYCCVDILNETGIGLDRININYGYIDGNVLPCCGNCNKVRNTVLTVDETKVAMDAVMRLRNEK